MAIRIHWSDDLSVGIPRIDKQHHEFINILNDLQDAIEKKKGKDDIEEVICFLEDYAVLHFSAEERSMIRYGFDGFKDHLAQHNIFRNSLQNLRKKYEVSGPTDSLADTLETQLCGWFMNHIQNVDTLFTAHLRSIGALEDVVDEPSKEEKPKASDGKPQEVEIIR